MHDNEKLKHGVFSPKSHALTLFFCKIFFEPFSPNYINHVPFILERGINSLILFFSLKHSLSFVWTVLHICRTDHWSTLIRSSILNVFNCFIFKRNFTKKECESVYYVLERGKTRNKDFKNHFKWRGSSTKKSCYRGSCWMQAIFFFRRKYKSF